MLLKFSIIIPVYNVAPYLRECMDSVLAQTYDSWEAICVDDGSTDGSGAILEEYAAKDKRFRIVHQKNAGVSSARNTALDIARGEYVGFLDGDDVIAPYLLRKILNVTSRAKGVDYVNYAVRFGGKKDFVDWRDSSATLVSYEGTENAIRARASMLVKFAGTCGGYYRRELIGDVRFDTALVAREDTLLHLELLNRLKTVAEIGCQCYFYRMGRSANSCSKRRVSQSLAFYDAVEGLLNYALGTVVDEHLEVRRCISKVITRDFALCMAAEMDLNSSERVHYRRMIEKFRKRHLFDLEGLSWLDRFNAALIIYAGVYMQISLVKTLRRMYKRVRMGILK